MPISIVSHKLLSRAPQPGYNIMYVGPAAEGSHAGEYITNDRSSQDNISAKNPFYCELTALYALWKNDKKHTDDIYGLVHYRRRFIDINKRAYVLFDSISRIDGLRSIAKKWFLKHELTYDKAQKILKEEKCDFILPQPEVLKHSVAMHYAKLHYLSDLETVRKIISEYYPDYLFAFDVCVHNNECSPYNMFISNHEHLSAYADWLFDILERTEQLISLEGRTKNQARVFGFLSERLFNIYILKNRFKVKYLPVFLLRRE